MEFRQKINTGWKSEKDIASEAAHAYRAKKIQEFDTEAKIERAAKNTAPRSVAPGALQHASRRRGALRVPAPPAAPPTVQRASRTARAAAFSDLRETEGSDQEERDRAGNENFDLKS